MKKVFVLLLSMFIFAGNIFAQSEVSALPDDKDKMDLSKKVIVPEVQHTTDKTAKVKIDYIPIPQARTGTSIPIAFVTSGRKIPEPPSSNHPKTGCFM